MKKNIKEVTSNPATKKAMCTVAVCIGILIFINGVLSFLNARKEKREAQMREVEEQNKRIEALRVKVGDVVDDIRMPSHTCE